NTEYRKQVAAVQALIHHRFEQHLRAGDQARAAGNPERAQTAYLKALALDPLRTEPLPRLRELDRERALAAQTARLAKLRGRQGEGSAGKRGAPPAQAAAGQQERDYLETGISLLQQGAYEESILELEKYLRSFPDDRDAQGHLAEARRKLSGTPAAADLPAPAVPRATTPPPAAPPAPVAPPSAPSAPTPRAPMGPAPADKALAQELYEKGLRVSRTDLDQAIRYWEESLARDPEHVQARLQLERALRMQRSLQEIPAQ
ncbi:MAG: tetratricopeptide repeat protein, partial [Thermodesulfobacteriota bacterium]